MKKFVIFVLLLVVFAAVHRSRADEATPPEEGSEKACSHCHEEMVVDHARSVHRDITCLTCHPAAVKEEHEKQNPVNCLKCHSLHNERVIHDAHSRVSCKACHVKDGLPAVQAQTKRIVWSGTFREGTESGPHQLVRMKSEKGCRNCHYPHNSVGAGSTALPPKSFLCMPCHAATFSLQDTVSRVALLVFVLGMAGILLVWFSGRTGEGLRTSARLALENNGKLEGSPRELVRPEEHSPADVTGPPGPATAPARDGNGGLSSVLGTLGADLFLQRRLYRLSPARWAIHGLIVFPMVVRFGFGLVALTLSLTLPNVTVTGAMLDKNHPVVAFLFDLTGLLILAGVIAAIYRNARLKETEISELPESGWGMSALLGSIVLIGFFLEGMRIAMTGWPDGSGYAFAGYGISLLIKGVGGLQEGYGYAWYLHALLVGLFVAMIPFTRMSHIITAPLVLIANGFPAKNEP